MRSSMMRCARNVTSRLALGALTTCGTGASVEDPLLTPGPPGMLELVENTSCVIEQRDESGALVAPLPLTLSATGCYQDLVTKKAIPALIPITYNSWLWTDGVQKRRYLALPPGGKVGFDELKTWDMPVGTIAMKEFIVERELGNTDSWFVMETRFFVRSQTTWAGYSYMWNDDGTDGTLLEGGLIKDYEVTRDGAPALHTHDFPSRIECIRCHPLAAGGVIGLQTAQMNGNFDYELRTANQIETLDFIGVFTKKLTTSVADMPRLPHAADPDASVESRARSWIHANCSHCHRENGTAEGSALDLRFNLGLAKTNACQIARPGQPPGIYPGDPFGSDLWLQISNLTMPPVAVHIMDPKAIVVHDWINAMTSCP
jgi:hypothetical protein